MATAPVDVQIEPGSPGTMVGVSMTNANESIDKIAKNMRILVKKVSDLRHLGIENQGLPLPKIVVVGDQSVGKSSLVEGMSEIQVPRSAGCCTRCPLEINLSDSDSPDAPWTCKVILMKKYIFDASVRLQRATYTKQKPLGPWIEQDPEELLFATLTDKDQLQSHLQWAQLATLNPGRSHTDYLPGNDQDADSTYTQVKFSPNVVRLDISSRGFPNLSFYDLPGVINVAEVDDERYLVDLVENLVKEYIKPKHSIILLVLPMTDDATNSSAARIIRSIPGARERTVGVLTKPDRVELKNGNEYDQWYEILRGDKFSTGHGYYVVQNNPNPTVSHATAREEEAMFFSYPPWKTNLAEYSDRFGTRNLQAALSKLLLGLIQDSLPGIVEKINKQAEHVHKELSKLPNPPSANIPYILCQKLNVFMNKVQLHVDGGSPNYPFLKEWGSLASAFQMCLAKSRPGVHLRDDAHDHQTQANREGSTEEHVANGFVTPKRRNAVSPIGADGTKRVKLVDGPVTSAVFEQFSKPARMFTLMEIRNVNQDTYAAGVPGLANPHAVEAINKLSVSHWREPLITFLNVTYTQMSNMLSKEMRSVFGQHEKTALFDELNIIIINFLESIRADHVKQAEEHFLIEWLKPFTMACTLFQRGLEETRVAFQKKRLEVRAQRHARAIDEYRAIAGIKSKTDPNKVTKDELGPDEYEKELEILSASRAYYDIAASRFIDITCQTVHIKLFMCCKDKLRGVIEKELGILEANASERCMELMVEDRSRQMKRTHLMKEKEKLEKAQKSLQIGEETSEPAPLFCDFDTT